MVPREAGNGQGGSDPDPSDNPMLILVSGILLLGGISLLILWGLDHAYS